MLILNTKDMAAVVSCKEVIDTMEEAIMRAGRGEFETPLRTQVANKGNTLLLMPSFFFDLAAAHHLAALFEKTRKK